MFASVLLSLALAGSALAHGQVRWFITSTTTWAAADAYASSPDPNSPLRKLNTYGPASMPPTNEDIVCGPGGNNPAAVVAPVVAGTQVTFDWGQWTSSHPVQLGPYKGPVMTYIALCPNGCTTFKGDTGNVWVKIQQDGYDPARTPAWAEQLIEAGGANGHGTWTITIPSSLPNGQYLLRHEILGLHIAYELDGAQFYPNCVQIQVTGGGNVPLPAGVPFPGEYSDTDPGVYPIELYTITPQNPAYIIPGGPILYPPGASGSASPPPSSTSSVKASSSSSISSSKPATSTSSSKTSSSTSSTKTSSASGAGQTLYGQCGGTGWTGPTTCASGTCKVSNTYYSQCLPS